MWAGCLAFLHMNMNLSSDWLLNTLKSSYLVSGFNANQYSLLFSNFKGNELGQGSVFLTVSNWPYRAIGLMSIEFVNGPGDRGSIPGRVIPKTQKIVLDAALLSTQYYKVRIKGKVEQCWEWCSALPNTSVW